MLSSKLKSWVESHLTRKKSSSGGSKKSSSSGSTTGNNSSHCKESPADRIAHPASSLVNLVPAVPLCSSSGRSNAGLVIRLQNDFAAAASVSSPCHRSHHPSWSRSPVMLAWNSKIPASSPLPRPPPLHDPPISPPPSVSSTIQNGEPSPCGSDWTSKSFAGESGIGGNNGSLASSKATTGSSMCTADFDSGGRTNAPSLSSPESAYSTGCSDGVSPSQDGLFDPPHPQTLLLDPVWRRSLMDADGSGTNSSSQSPRTRPAIRTNPWLPVRTSMTSSDRASWMTDSTPEAVLLEMPQPVKETDIVSSDSQDDISDPVAAALAAKTANQELDQLCDSLQLLMDGDNLRVITQQNNMTTATTTSCGLLSSSQSSGSCRNEPCGADGCDMDGRWNVDDQYTLLIRQTEEILLQLEKDELLLAGRKQVPEEHGDLLMHQHPLNGTNNNNSRPCSVSSGPQYRRRLRKTAAMRRCSSRNSRDIFSSSSESSDCDYSGSSNSRRMLMASSTDWNAFNRRPRSANRNNSTGRFATRQNARVLPHLPASAQPVLPPPPTPPRDCWILGSQLSSCSPDDWTTEHDRPPSPAPMDPHCHWPAVQLRLDRRARSPSMSGSTTGSSRRNSPSYQQQQQYRQHLAGGSSCPTSPAIRDWHPDQSRRGNGPAGRRWRQSMTREQQRLESQIAFLRRQLKDVTDDYYYHDGHHGGGTPSSSSDSSDSARLK